jgi:hypothetical protein
LGIVEECGDVDGHTVGDKRFDVGYDEGSLGRE